MKNHHSENENQSSRPVSNANGTGSNGEHSWLNERGQLILLLGGIFGLILIMYKINHLLNPLGYGLIFSMVLYPIRKQPVARAVLYAIGFATGFWFLYDSGHLLIPFIIAFIIAFLFNPVVELLEQKGVSRTLIAIFFTLMGFVIIGAIFFFAIPALRDQMVRLSALFIEATNNTDALIDDLGVFTLAERIGLQVDQFRPQLANQLNELMTSITQNVTSLSAKTVSSVTNIIGVLFFIILLPFLLFFMIRDFQKIGSFVRSLMFSSSEEEYAREIARIVGSYLRGQFIVVIISAINLSIGFTLFGVPYGLLLGIFAGLTNFIPTFGLWVSVTVCSIVGATLGDPWYQFLPWIYLVFGVEQVLETGYIVPRVVGKHVGLHPITVMISLLIFGFMFGFLGLLIAVPTVALLAIFYEQYRETGKISFLHGSELDTFLQQFDRPDKSITEE
jgi:predicted PurR-regulated permease PerM